MILSNQVIYTFSGLNSEQVGDLRYLWQEAVMEWSEERGWLRIKSDQDSIDQFLMFYELYQYLGYHGPINVKAESAAAERKPLLRIV